MLPVIIQMTNKQITFANRNFADVCKVPVIEFLTGRVVKAGAFPIAAAITDSQEDDSLESKFRELGITIYRGSHDDVPQRLLNTAKLVGVESFARVLGNNPLVDVDLMKSLYDMHVDGGFEYSFNGHEYGTLWGMDCDVISQICLKKIISERLPLQNADSFAYHIRQKKERYNVNKQSFNEKRAHYKLFLETEKDLALVNDIARNVKSITSENVKVFLDKHPALAGSNRESPEKEVGLDKLYLHPEKLSALLNLDDATIDNSYPLSVELSLTNACNLNCVYCSDGQLRKRQGKSSQLSLECLEGLFADLKEGGTKGVVIEGGGEPCLHPRFSDIIRAAKRCGLAAGLITNGTVDFDTEIIKEFEWIRVSLDASTENEYLSLKQADEFNKVLENITKYSACCDVVGVGYVVTNKNISELESLVLRLRDSGASYLQLRPVVDCDELYPKDTYLGYLAFYQSSRFGVIIDGMSENSEAGNFGIGCNCHSLTSVISADGSVHLCGRLCIYDWVEPIGNINVDSFRSIWTGDKRRNLALKVKNRDFCKTNCPQCRISKFNKRIMALNAIESKNFI